MGRLTGGLWPLGRFSRFGARWAGRREGKRNYPGVEMVVGPDGKKRPAWPDDRPQGYLAEVKNQAELELRVLAGAFQRDKQSLADKRVIASTHQNEAATRVGQLEAQTGSEEHRAHLSRVAHGLLLAVLFLVEWPLNSIAFRLFGESEALTWLMTLGLVVAFMAGARFIGVYAKEPVRTEFQKRASIAAACGVLLVIIGVAYVREQYLVRMGQTPDRMLTLTFVMVQVVIFAVAVLVTYFAHDPLRDEKDRLLHHSIAADRSMAEEGHVQARYARMAAMARDSAQILMSNYETTNITSRTDGTTVLPRVTIQVPEELRDDV